MLIDYLESDRLSTEYLSVIRPYLRNLINDLKPKMELNNNDITNTNNNTNTNNTNTNTNTNNDNNNTNTNNNNNNNNSSNTNNNNTNTNTTSNRAEWKIQLIMQNNFTSVKDFEDTRTIYSASKPVEIFLGSDTESIIDTIFNTILKRIQEAMETSNERGSGFTHEGVGLLYYHLQRIDLRRGGSCIASPDWIASKKATINPKNEKDNERFKWSIIAG